jgi:hypothetical protein
MTAPTGPCRELRSSTGRSIMVSSPSCSIERGIVGRAGSGPKVRNGEESVLLFSRSIEIKIERIVFAVRQLLHDGFHYRPRLGWLTGGHGLAMQEERNPLSRRIIYFAWPALDWTLATKNDDDDDEEEEDEVDSSKATTR